MNTVLFDLDGTLLPMDQEAFIRLYFGALTQKFEPYGFDPQKLIQGLWAGMKAMQENDGSKTNEDVFWQAFTGLAGERALAYRPDFDVVLPQRVCCGKKSDSPPSDGGALCTSAAGEGVSGSAGDQSAVSAGGDLGTNRMGRAFTVRFCAGHHL